MVTVAEYNIRQATIQYIRGPDPNQPREGRTGQVIEERRLAKLLVSADSVGFSTRTVVSISAHAHCSPLTPGLTLLVEA